MVAAGGVWVDGKGVVARRETKSWDLWEYFNRQCRSRMDVVTQLWFYIANSEMISVRRVPLGLAPDYFQLVTPSYIPA